MLVCFCFWQGSVHTEQTFHCSLILCQTSWSLWLTLLFKEQVVDPHDLWLYPEKHSKQLAELCHLIPTLLDWLVWFPCCPRDSQAPQFESISSSVLSLLYDPTLTSIHDYYTLYLWLFGPVLKETHWKDWRTDAEAKAPIFWPPNARKWQPTPVFLPGESHGWRSLVGCSPWGRRVGHDSSDLAAAMQKANTLEKTLILGKIEGKRRRGWPSMRWLDNITNSMDMNLSKLQEIVKGSLECCSPWGHKQLNTT